MRGQEQKPTAYPIPGILEKQVTMVHTFLLCPPLYHPSLATLRAWDLREATELTYWICVVGRNTTASGTFKPTLKPASRPSTSARLDVVRHGGSAAAAVAAEAEGGSRSRGGEREEEESGLGSGWVAGLDKKAGVGHNGARADVEPTWTVVLASTRANMVKM